MPPRHEPGEGWNAYTHQTLSRSHSSSSRAPASTPIVIEPDENKQRIYNQTRDEQKRINQNSQAAPQTNDELLSPSHVAPAMSRSLTSESNTSSNCSASGETPRIQEPASTEPSQGRRPRGRRSRPLDADTRLHTALKRKLKLTCIKHRQKKTTVRYY